MTTVVHMLYNFFAGLLKSGINFPVAAKQNNAAARLLFSHVSFYIAVYCILTNAPQTWVSIAFFTICCLLYSFRDLTSAKIDFDDKEIELTKENGG